MFAPAYFDWNATAPLDSRVREAMLPWLGERFGNPSSRHEYGRQARAAIEEARARVAAACGAHASEVIFTSGGSEANNLFIKGAAGCLKPGTVAISAIEHPCVREPARQLRSLGWRFEQIGVDEEGRLRSDEWERIMAMRPQLLSVMLANNETGVLQDVAALSGAVRQQGGWLHSDAVQALGKISVDFHALGVHALTLSSHKIGGPLGAGALVLDKRVELMPLVAGGGQERNLRAGTENVAAIVGFGAACETALARLEAESERLTRLRISLEDFLRGCGCRIFSERAARLPNTVFFADDGIEGETLVAKLDRAGFACASGSACSSAQPGVSQTLTAMGVAPEIARGAVRISLGRSTGEEDISRFAASYRQLSNELKNLTAMTV